MSIDLMAIAQERVWGPYCVIGWHRGVVIPTPYHHGSIYDLIQSSSSVEPSTPTAPVAGAREARSSGITGDADDDAEAKTRDS